MKASLFSGILLIVVAALVVMNGVASRRITDTLFDMISRLPNEPSEAAVIKAGEILSYLKKNETFFSLSVPYQTLDRCMELASALKEYATVGSCTDYTATKTLLMDAIEDMGRLETVSLKHIF